MALSVSDVERWPAGPDRARRAQGRANSEPRNVAATRPQGRIAYAPMRSGATPKSNC
jgi:hypothetical protein